MSYIIQITKVESMTVTKRGDHTVIKEQPWTEESLEEAPRHYQSKEDFIKHNPVQKVYGYAPDWKGIEKKETEVLKQTVEDLDLAAVIKAVNNI